MAPCQENCSGLCCGPGWMLDYNFITYVKKIWQYECIHVIAYFSVLFVSEYIVMDIIYENDSFFRCCKYVVGLL